MHHLILNNPGRFAFAWLAAVVTGTGLGAVAISFGIPTMVVVYTQLALQIALVLAIAFGVPERSGGLMAATMTMVLPFGAFVAWAEVALSHAQTTAALVAGFGAALACAGVWDPRGRVGVRRVALLVDAPNRQ